MELEYDEVLKPLLNILDNLVEELNNDVKKEFTSFTHLTDRIIDFILATDKEDFLLLSMQMHLLAETVTVINECPCDNIKMHTYTNRIGHALLKAATHMQEHLIRVANKIGVELPNIPDLKYSEELPELPTDIVVPDDIKDVDK